MAITTDGHVNVSMVTFGEMNGNLIKANSVVIGALNEEITNKIDSAQSSTDNAQTNANDAISKAKKAQEDADDASKLANNAWQGIDDLSQVIVADGKGVKVKEARNSENYARYMSDGVHIFVADLERAKIGIESHFNSVAISGYLMAASHRIETIMETMGDNEKEECTALYWTGDVK